MMNALTVIFAGIAALGGLGWIPAFLIVRARNNELQAKAKHLNVDADVLVSGQALELYDRVSAEAKDARDRAGRCEDKVDALQDHVNVLNRLIRELGGDPPTFRYPILNIASGDHD